MFDNGNRPIYTVNQAARIAEDAAEKALKRFMALNSTSKEAAPCHPMMSRLLKCGH